MNIPQLEITHQDAQIEINTQRAQVEINSRRPHFTLYRSNARMSVDRRLPTMHLDRTQTDLALNRGPIMLTTQRNNETAQQDMLNSIGSSAAQGTAPLNAAVKGSTAGTAAAQMSAPQTLDIKISSLPQAQIDWDPGYLDVNWTPGALDLQWDVNSQVDIRVEPSYIDIRMSKYPEITMRVVYKDNSADRALDKYL